MNITVETKREIFEPGEADYHWRVGPDGDGLGGVEIAYIEGGKARSVVSMRPEVARRVAECLLKAADEADAQKD